MNPFLALKPSYPSTGFGVDRVIKLSQLTENQVESDLDPNNPKIFTDGAIDAEVISVQEEGKSEVKVKSKNDVPLTLVEKEALYVDSIEKDTKNIAAAKERIKHNKIRLRKLRAFMKQEEARREKALLDL